MYFKIVFLLLSFILPDAWANSVSLDLSNFEINSSIIQLIGLVSILSLAPSILVMVTAFTRIMVVLSILRNAIGLQQTPPNSVLISLALFLTAFIMTPTFEKSYKEGLYPVIESRSTLEESFPKIAEPFKLFMLKNVNKNDLKLFFDLSNHQEELKEETDTPWQILIPAFLISELKRAFEIGFLLFLPFVIIDMLIASILMAMGMMMVPPAMIAMPVKIIFFVLIDGFYLISGSLVKSFYP